MSFAFVGRHNNSSWMSASDFRQKEDCLIWVKIIQDDRCRIWLPPSSSKKFDHKPEPFSILVVVFQDDEGTEDGDAEDDEDEETSNGVGVTSGAEPTSSTSASTEGIDWGGFVEGSSRGTVTFETAAVVAVVLSVDSGGAADPRLYGGWDGGLSVGSFAVLQTFGWEAINHGGLGRVVVVVVAATRNKLS